MGREDDPRAVVDCHGRLLGGVEGLRVVDASDSRAAAGADHGYDLWVLLFLPFPLDDSPLSTRTERGAYLDACGLYLGLYRRKFVGGAGRGCWRHDW